MIRIDKGRICRVSGDLLFTRKAIDGPNCLRLICPRTYQLPFRIKYLDAKKTAKLGILLSRLFHNIEHAFTALLINDLYS